MCANFNTVVLCTHTEHELCHVARAYWCVFIYFLGLQACVMFGRKSERGSKGLFYFTTMHM